ncbi:methyltransferase-like protein 27 [Lingula anatina]|uniref:Methyltransferase-like protein 27 n=1 Tax=Lingula anatina TaxID=7574 RepID=A0A1S3JFG3_LINAN|nr:methyltransferase-like protein 27 [Lingula anatina]|eukprot:XP_013409155.1 methyltransferase-like protein 27 [Lingula anatina]
MSTSRMEEVWDIIIDTSAAADSVETSQELYRQWAPDYDQDNVDVHYNGPKLSALKIAQLFGENKDVLILDAGAGTGLVGKELQNLGFTNLEALDGSQEMLDVANQKGIYKRSMCSLLGPIRLDIDSGYYDCVVCIGSVAANHANAGCLPELIRITKSGGYVFIATREDNVPNSGYDGKSWDDWLKIHEDNGLWKKVEIRRVEDWIADVHGGMMYMYQVM